MLLVEHDIEFIMNACDRIVVMDRGVKIADDVPAKVRDDENVIAAISAEEPSMLRIENLRAGYRGSDALHSVSIRVERGAIVSVVGANGAGKSTLINAICHNHSQCQDDAGRGREHRQTGTGRCGSARHCQWPKEGCRANDGNAENLRLGFHRLAEFEDAAQPVFEIGSTMCIRCSRFWPSGHCNARAA